MDLFTHNLTGRFAVYKKTSAVVMIRTGFWFRGSMNYDVLVPEMSEKGKINFCHATYSASEIDLLDIWLNDI